MSWIFGEIKKNLHSEFRSNISDAKSLFKSERSKIQCGGYSENLKYSEPSNSESGWIVSGIGIQTKSESSKVCNHNDWELILKGKNRHNSLSILDGHFSIVVWDKDKLCLYTDPIGLRDFYMAEDETSIFFTTNAVWLSDFLNMEVDFNEFGSRWLLFNQISQNSIFKNVERLVAGKRIEINLKPRISIKHYEFNWTPIISETYFGLDDYSKKLNRLTNISSCNQSNIGLFLSGGMDSRVILSYLLKDKIDFDAYTFGNKEHPDSIIAKLISGHYNIQQEQLQTEIPSVDDCIKGIQDYTSLTLVNNAASAFIQLSNYEHLSDKNTFLIDGGFGEIWRREFFYKLYLKGKSDLLNGNINAVIPYLALHRADIFSEDIAAQMRNGVQKQLQDLVNQLPKIDKIGFGNWLDLFAIKTRIANYYSHEQTRMDGYLSGAMPFLQPSLLYHLFEIPISLRQNGKLYRKLIQRNLPSLKNFKLAKGSHSYPYRLNSIQFRVWSLLRNILKLSMYKDRTSYQLFEVMKEYIRDTINSKEVKENPLYDYGKIKNIVESYYQGDFRLINELDWWLSYELFTRKISNNKL